MKYIVSLLAAARLTRFITTDWLGEWLIVAPLKKRAGWDDGTDAPVRTMNGETVIEPPDMHYGTWPQRLATGFDCAFCVSFWATATILFAEALPLPRWASRLRSTLIGSLAGSYVVGHLTSRVDTD